MSNSGPSNGELAGTILFAVFCLFMGWFATVYFSPNSMTADITNIFFKHENDMRNSKIEIIISPLEDNSKEGNTIYNYDLIKLRESLDSCSNLSGTLDKDVYHITLKKH